MRPWEIYWLVEAKTKDTPARRQQEDNAHFYDLLQQAKAKEKAA